MTATVTFSVGSSAYDIVDLPAEAGEALERLPYIHRILLENVLRTAGEDAVAAKTAILAWLETGTSEEEIPFLPARVLMHDTTCGPALVDIAGLRSAIAEAGGDPSSLNPVVPVDVSTDHSVAVDVFGGAGSLEQNMKREYERNAERYRFMKWATNTLSGFRVHPPGTGIMHTLNLERLATVVISRKQDGMHWAMPDTLIGTDSHTPMINGIGVLGWGVGGLEAESVFFGMPVSMRVPDVIGVKLTGALTDGVLATDLALTVTQRLRQVDLQDRYVEFFGPGVCNLSAGDRSVVANMTPEFGGNSGYFPIDARTLDYLRSTGRSEEHVEFVEAYAKRVGIWFDPDTAPRYTSVIEMDLSEVEASLAGPTRPQDRIALDQTVKSVASLNKPPAIAGGKGRPGDGAVAIAAITSCTNTSDPRLVIAAGLLARKARHFGLKPPAWVKTSLAPGSPTAERYLRRAGLMEDLEAVGFGIVGYGCTTCIGNSGPLTEPISTAMSERGILPVAVLSGNRNFPGRVHPQLEAGFLASPPIVVAFALAGTVMLDITKDPIGLSSSGKLVTLSMLWPTSGEIDTALARGSSAGDFQISYEEAEASKVWQALEAPTSMLFPWDPSSTYIRRPPFTEAGQSTRLGVYEAHPILVVGDDITTDHISPAGAVSAKSEAGQYLIERGESPIDLNVFASRRGNWEAMVRGLFTNRSVRNMLAKDIPPGSTTHFPSGEIMPLWRAADRYTEDQQSVVMVAGERYGMGSSRDWAAKGVALLGVRAVLASSFERIHRANLIGMGVLPLRLPAGLAPVDLRLQPGDMLNIRADPASIRPRCSVEVNVRRGELPILSFAATAAVETAAEVAILRAGGVLPLILTNEVHRSC
ncbi:aconitate hydratase AcnA [Rhizobium leguminosarum]|uniref:aconitate hydratase AcnA n=1 Tax=Rhizobium leguminosarum TaxID=384 RepID=UPI0013C23D5E|nr:aconitate hydratase AcnA [Rhizobium leguminosarum]NEI03036.1 aconitate hydratase AcnA [Rhizobium leguminosarum]NEJ47454.1 aconitate hydratase AcnA [Rhizobium leguminosarum]NEJ54403.1 aconitate hydratase AcnA [Rhizobium leguminosarum]NEJ82246.1 aconitate hydratase AcnA [Rhizobium leguminosarum]